MQEAQWRELQDRVITRGIGIVKWPLAAILLFVLIRSYVLYWGPRVDVEGYDSVFWGFLHGLLLLPNLLIWLFNDNFTFFDEASGWYNIGFLAGIVTFFGACFSASDGP